MFPSGPFPHLSLGAAIPALAAALIGLALITAVVFRATAVVRRRAFVAVFAIAVSALAAVPRASAQIPVTDSAAIAQIINEIHEVQALYQQAKGFRDDFNDYKWQWLLEEVALQNLGFYEGKWDPTLFVKPVRDSFGRIHNFFDAENYGTPIFIKPGYEGATAWKLTPDRDTSNQDVVEDASALIDTVDSQVQVSMAVVGDYKRENREELETMLASLQYELTEPEQSQKAILQRILAAGVLQSRELNFTNRLLAEQVLLTGLNTMATRNNLTYGVNANIVAAQEMPKVLTFMDDPQPFQLEEN